MARPTKQGLDYFPFDVGFFGDNNVRILKARYRADGIAVYVKLLCDIYKEGYFLSVGCWEDYIFVIADEIGATPDKVEQIITFLHNRAMIRIYRKDELTGYDLDAVITSHGIQARYAVAVKSRRKKSISDIKRGFWLLSEDEEKEIDAFYKGRINEDFSENNPDKSENNPDKSENNPTKESKIKRNICTDVPSARDSFFQTYPDLSKTSEGIDDSFINYNLLLEFFQRSKKYLQTRSHFTWIVKHYGEIINGKYDDFPDCKTQKEIPALSANVKAANDRADREQYYSALRQQAEQSSAKNLEVVRGKFGKFEELEKEHRKLELDIAKKEILYEKFKTKINLDALESVISRKDIVEQKMVQYVKLCGFTMDDLLPKWHCIRCQDTGWKADGKACDCYKK